LWKKPKTLIDSGILELFLVQKTLGKKVADLSVNVIIMVIDRNNPDISIRDVDNFCSQKSANN